MARKGIWDSSVLSKFPLEPGLVRLLLNPSGIAFLTGKITVLEFACTRASV
jgi:hypothetical protein